MNLPQFLKMIDNTTSKMTKEELAESIHHIARTLPEEHRDWLVSMLSDDSFEKTEPEETVPDDLYKELYKIISGEYRLDSEINEEWDDWYASDEPDFLFEDNDDLLSVIEDAGSELHRPCGFISKKCPVGYRLRRLLYIFGTRARRSLISGRNAL